MGEKQPWRHKGQKEGGGGAPGARAEIPIELLVKTMVKKVVPLQLVEDRTREDIHAATHGGPMLQQVAVS